MPDFRTNPFATPFGRNVFLRSTRGVKTESRTLAHETVPAVTIDGHPGQKVLQPGTVLAKITSGPDIGKVGPFQAAGSGANEVQTITEATAITAGTFTVTLFPGEDGTVTTADIAHDATAATVQAAFRAALADSTDEDVAEYADSITVTGGPVGTTALTVTYVGAEGRNVPALTVDVTDLTGTVTVATTTAGVAGATDGRGTLANIVGICNTFLPWQLMERDVEVACIYEAAVVQAKCIELNAAGEEIALSDTTAAQMFGKKALNITFHVGSTENGDN
jgi:hypothetical protein